MKSKERGRRWRMSCDKFFENIPKVMIKPVSISVLDFVASKNGRKYHFLWCSAAERILPENMILFKTEKKAKIAGYQPSNCKGGCLMELKKKTLGISCKKSPSKQRRKDKFPKKKLKPKNSRVKKKL